MATIASARSTANNGSAKSTPCVARTGIASAAASTIAGTNQNLVRPSIAVRDACHAINPAAPAASKALRSFADSAAPPTENKPKSGARITG